MLHSDVVINLIGREYETRNFKFADVNVEGPKMLARLARECGVKDFIHISSLNAREKPKVELTNCIVSSGANYPIISLKSLTITFFNIAPIHA